MCILQSSQKIGGFVDNLFNFLGISIQNFSLFCKLFCTVIALDSKTHAQALAHPEDVYWHIWIGDRIIYRIGAIVQKSKKGRLTNSADEEYAVDDF